MAAPADPPGGAALADAWRAAALLRAAPGAFGGMVLRGAGPARDALVAALADDAAARGARWVQLPGHVDDERLGGGVDVAASLAAGRLVHHAGLLAAAAGGLVVVRGAERLDAALAGRLAQELDARGLALLLLDDGVEPDERPPALLTERLAFAADLGSERPAPLTLAPPRAPDSVAPLTEAQATALAAAAEAFGIDSARPLLFAAAAARAHAAAAGRDRAIDDDLAAAARLVLAPRAQRLPPADDDESAAPDAAPPPPADDAASDTAEAEGPAADVVLDAVRAAIPADVLDSIANGRAPRGARGGGRGLRVRALQRGRPLGARPGQPRGGLRLALIDTLRAAVPWQPVRRRERPDAPPRLLLRKEDLRIRRFEARAASVTIFCVDASGSAAMARLAEAKGAAELILAQAYVKRTEVALIAFRGSGAELLLPPTRSLTRAKRALADLPGGGGTPLAQGITLAHQLAEAIAARGRTPSFVFLTDGSANIAADGTPGRGRAAADALAAARALAARGLDAVVVDISPRPRPDAERLAEAMRARYLPLPMADAKALNAALNPALPARR